MLQSIIVTSQSQAEYDKKEQVKESHTDQNEISAVPQLLAELIDIATKIAKADQMMAEVDLQYPQDPAAEKWREISKQAVTFSKDAMKAQQNEILEKLKSCTSAPAVPTITSITPDFVEAKEDEPSTPSTTDHTSCPSEVSWPATPPGLERHPVSAPTMPPGLDCEPTAGKEPGLCKVVQDLREQYGIRSMRKEIETLKQYSERRVLIVRKIKTLGFESSEILRNYFGQFGAVDEVIVPHSFTKPGPQRKLGRIRPGVMGFVVMNTTEGAEAAIAHGESQTIHAPKGADATVQVVWFKDSYTSEDTEV